MSFHLAIEMALVTVGALHDGDLPKMLPMLVVLKLIVPSLLDIVTKVILISYQYLLDMDKVLNIIKEYVMFI